MVPMTLSSSNSAYGTMKRTVAAECQIRSIWLAIFAAAETEGLFVNVATIDLRFKTVSEMVLP